MRELRRIDLIVQRELRKYIGSIIGQVPPFARSRGDIHTVALKFSTEILAMSLGRDYNGWAAGCQSRPDELPEFID
jgi:hypothetical protein